VILQIPADAEPKRIDRLLADLLPERTRSFLARLVEQGSVAVDGVRVEKKSHLVLPGQTISIQIPEPKPIELASRDIPLTVVYQDSDIAVVDKPAGVVVHPAAGHADDTLVNALLHHIGDLSGIGGVVRPGIVHRLDKDTSGLLVVAKNDAAHNALKAVWGTDDVRKEYLALVYGTPKVPEGRIEKPIGRDPSDRKRMSVVTGGRRSITLFRVEEAFPNVSLLRCTLQTGRTHQIRVHLKAIGHPIIGDPVYAGPQWRGIPDKRMQKLIASIDRQALHAARLCFPHPRSGAPMSFEAPLPEDFAGLLAALRR
jgi:23S rRNA pseudouridine1911/1915/1917 synthase